MKVADAPTGGAKISEEDLVAKIVGLVEERWAERSEAIYLTAIATSLLNDGIDYKELIHNKPLKFFLLENASDRIKIVEDPVHKARVGFIPVGKTFEFRKSAEREGSVTDGRQFSKPDKISSRHPKHLVDFLSSLGDLTAEEQASVVIPTNVLVKIIRGGR